MPVNKHKTLLSIPIKDVGEKTQSPKIQDALT